MFSDRDYIVNKCYEFACSNGLKFEWESPCLYPYNVTVRFSTRNHGYKTESFYYNDVIHDPRKFVQDVITELTNKWLTGESVEEPKPKLTGDQYREQLVEQIKAAGQDLIDRAESFVAADLDAIGRFSIEIDIPQDGPVEIVTKMKTYCKSDKYYMASMEGE
jgi:hypothetical protein